MTTLFYADGNVGIFGMNIISYPEKKDCLPRYNMFSENDVDKLEGWHPVLLRDMIMVDINYYLEHQDEITVFAEKYKRK